MIMNREIKFRAKDVQTGDWRYGYLVLHETQDHGVIIVHGDKEYHDENLYYEWDIDPKTAGQYIGKKDKNKKEIYEKDVLKMVLFDHRLDEDPVIIGHVEWDHECTGFYMIDTNNKNWFEIGSNTEIIGNKFENPGLLEKQS